MPAKKMRKKESRRQKVGRFLKPLHEDPLGVLTFTAHETKYKKHLQKEKQRRKRRMQKQK